MVFVNNPITQEKNDILGIVADVDRIEEAIQDGAGTIGIIGDYGSGKSSIIELLKKRFNEKDIINVNMWSNSSNVLDDKKLTKNFIFQLAMGKDKRFAQYINKKLSKNYGVISLSISSLKYWKSGLISIIAFLFYKTLGMLPNNIYETNLYINLSQNGKIALTLNDGLKNLIRFSYGFLKDFRMLFILISIIFLFRILYKNVMAVFSSWNSKQEKKDEINDIYDSYVEVADEICTNKDKVIVVIEDLDRSNEPVMVKEFIKEIYKFNSVLPEDLKNKIVYIIALKSEEFLNQEEDKIYSKIFSYKTILNPIHNNDCEKVLLELLKQPITKIEKTLNIKLDKDLPKEFAYIVKGKNLTIREIKDRLNRSLQLYENIISKREKEEDVIEYKKCAVVAYLESKYPKEIKQLTDDESAFSELIDNSYIVKQKININDKEKIEKISKFIDSITDDFKKDISELITRNLIDDDFRMYFYNYPKGQKMKTVYEKKVENVLLYPDNKTIIENGDIKKAISINPNIISECYKKRKNEELLFPNIIFEHEDFFTVALDDFHSDLLEVMEKEIKWKNESATESAKMLSKISSFNLKKIDIFGEYTDLILKDFSQLTEQEIVNARKLIIQAVGKNIEQFKCLFINDDIPLITKSELELIQNKKLQLHLINKDIIDEDNQEYIIDTLNSDKLNSDDYNEAKDIYFGMDNTIVLSNIPMDLLSFLKINNQYDDTLFGSIYDAFKSDRQCIKLDTLEKYLNNLNINQLTNTAYEIIDNMRLSINLNKNILNKLKEEGFYYTYWLCIIEKDKYSELELSKKTEEKIEIIEEIFQNLGENIYKLRTEIIKNNLINAYSELFIGEYPFITLEELNLIDSIENLILATNTKKVTLDNIVIIAERMNDIYINKNDLLLIMKLFDQKLSDTIKDINIIDKFFISFVWKENIAIELEEQEKEYIYQVLYTPLKLNTPVIALEFSKKIGILVESLEKQIYSGISIGSIQIEDYFKLINELNRPTEETINIVIALNYQGRLNNKITEKLLEKNNYVQYIICKSLWNQNLTLELNTIDLLYYINAYNENEQVYEIMVKNEEFLQLILNNRQYENIKEHSKLKPLYKLRQPIDFVKFIFENFEENKICEYLEYEWIDIEGNVQRWHLNTADDSKQLKEFMCTTQNFKFLRNERIYDRIKEKLWNATERGNVTRYRNIKLKEIGDI